MERKKNKILRMSIIALCLALVMFGVWAVSKTARLDVDGTVGFTAHDCLVDVSATIEGDGVIETENGGTITYTPNVEGLPSPERTLFEKTRVGDADISKTHKDVPVGAVYFTDFTPNGVPNTITIKFVVENVSDFNIFVTVTNGIIENVRSYAFEDGAEPTLNGTEVIIEEGQTKNIYVTYDVNLVDGDYPSIDLATKFQIDFYFGRNPIMTELEDPEYVIFDPDTLEIEIAPVKGALGYKVDYYDEDGNYVGSEILDSNTGKLNPPSVVGNFTIHVSAIGNGSTIIDSNPVNTGNKTDISNEEAPLNTQSQWNALKNAGISTANLTKVVFTNKPEDYAGYTLNSSVNVGTGISSYFNADNTQVVFYSEKVMRPIGCASLFKDFTSLETVLLKNFDTSVTTNAANMFYNCPNLRFVDFTGCVLTKVTNARDMFYGCSSLAPESVRVPDSTYKELLVSSLKVTARENVFFNQSAYGWQFALIRNNINYKTINNVIYTTDSSKVSGYTKQNIKFNSGVSAYIKGSNLVMLGEDTISLNYADSMFKNSTELKTVTFENVNTVNVKNLDNMFAGCTNLTHIDFTKFDFTNVNSAISMIANCSSLGTKSIKVANAEIKNKLVNTLKCASETQVYYEGEVFVYTIEDWKQALTEAGIDVNSITEIDFVNSTADLSGYTKNASINITDVDTYINGTKVAFYNERGIVIENANSLFANCNGLTRVDLGGVVDEITTASNMFANSANLAKVNLTALTFDNVTIYENMFNGCTSLADNSIKVESSEKETLLVSTWGVATSAQVYYDVELSNWKTILSNAGYSYSNLTDISFTDEPLESVTNAPATFAKPLANTYADSNYTLITNVHFNDDTKVYMDGSTKLYIYNPNGIVIDTCYGLFSECYSLVNLNIKGLITDNVTTMERMFYYCSNLQNVDLSGLNTENVTTMENMFYCCEQLTSIDLSVLNTQNVTSFESLFYECSKLTSVNFEGLNTQNLETMENIFYYCSALVSVDFSSLDLSKLTSLYYAFYNCTSLESVNLLTESQINISSAYSIFYNCSKLTSLNLTKINICGISSYSSMFSGCTGLGDASITVQTRADKSRLVYTWGVATDAQVIYIDSTQDVEGSLQGSTLNKANITEITFTADTSLLSGYVLNEAIVLADGVDAYVNGTKLIYISENKIPLIGGASMFENYTSLTKITFNNVDASGLTSLMGMFATCSKLQTVDFGDSFNAINVNSLYYMFHGCTSLTTVNFGNSFDVRNATDMYGMFYNCSALETISFGDNFNANSVTNMSYLFAGCSKLKNVNFDNLNAQNLENLSYAFYKCYGLENFVASTFFNNPSIKNVYNLFYYSSLKTVDLTNLNVTNIEYMGGLFNYCQSLTQVTGLRSSNKVTSLSQIFYRCIALETVDLSGLDTSNVTKFNQMFYECTKLKSLDLSNFVTSNASDFSEMFYDCNKLTEIKGLNNFDVSKATNMGLMFYGCSSLTKLDLSSFENSLLTSTKSMFEGCSLVTELDLSGFNLQNIEDVSSMFYGCSSLTKVNLQNFDFTSVKTSKYNSWYNRYEVTDEYYIAMFGSCTSLGDSSIIVKDSAQAKLLVETFSVATPTQVYYLEASFDWTNDAIPKGRYENIIFTNKLDGITTEKPITITNIGFNTNGVTFYEVGTTLYIYIVKEQFNLIR